MSDYVLSDYASISWCSCTAQIALQALDANDTVRETSVHTDAVGGRDNLKTKQGIFLETD